MVWEIITEIYLPIDAVVKSIRYYVFDAFSFMAFMFLGVKGYMSCNFRFLYVGNSHTNNCNNSLV